MTVYFLNILGSNFNKYSKTLCDIFEYIDWNI